jgi:quinol monooxygenase YgiN
MIQRIVHMHFHQDEVERFLDLFNRHKEQIASQRGCRGLHLVQSPDDSGDIRTLSLWDSEDDLLRYRNSELFGTVWPATKALFDKPPSAESLAVLWAS